MAPIEKKYEMYAFQKFQLQSWQKIKKKKNRLTLPTVCKTKSTSHLLRKVLLSGTWNHHFWNVDLSKWKHFDKSPVIASLSPFTFKLLFSFLSLRNVQFSRLEAKRLFS